MVIVALGWRFLELPSAFLCRRIGVGGLLALHAMVVGFGFGDWKGVYFMRKITARLPTLMRTNSLLNTWLFKVMRSDHGDLTIMNTTSILSLSSGSITKVAMGEAITLLSFTG